MADAKERLNALLQQLETERDELKLQLGLAKLEAREEWQELEGKMDSLRGRLKVVGEEAKEAGGDVAAAADVLVGEIKEGFSKIRKLV
jgi:chromosome segregation ATPase